MIATASTAATKRPERPRIGTCDITSRSPSSAGALVPPAATMSPIVRHINHTGSRQNLERRPYRARESAPRRAQAELQHERVASDRYRRRIGVSGEPVQRQNEAVVDIAEAEPGLIELVGENVIAGGAEHDPVLR
jgi:hypothetical protein